MDGRTACSAGLLAAFLVLGVAPPLLISAPAARAATPTPDGDVALAGGQPAHLMEAVDDVSTHAVGTRRIAVLRFKFTTGPDYAATEAELRSAIFSGPRSLNAFVHSESGGRLTLTGDVFSDVLPASFSPNACSPVERSAWKAYLTARHPGDYDHVMLFVPFIDACAKVASNATLLGPTSWIFRGPVPHTIYHEFGHNLGFHHASTIACTDSAGAPVAMSNSCSFGDEYTDMFSAMGSKPCGYGAPHRIAAGWQPPTIAPTTSTTVTLRAVDAGPGPQPQVLSLPRVSTDAFGNRYDIEWRRTTPVDCFDYAAAGLQIRVAPDPQTDRHSYLVDATPGSVPQPLWLNTLPHADGALPPGHTFTDPVTGIKVKLVALNRVTGLATIEVTIGAPPGARVEMVGSELRVTGDDGPNDIRVTQRNGHVVVSDRRALVLGTGCQPVKKLRTRATCAVPTRTVVDGRGGDDRFTARLAGESHLIGGDGDDVVRAGARPDGPTRFDGGTGTDRIDYSVRRAPVRITLDGADNDGAAGERDAIAADVEELFGGLGDDEIAGAEGPQTLRGRAGNDTLEGGGGDDYVLGEDGTDTMRGDAGADFVRADDEVSEIVDCGAGGGDRVIADADPRDTLLSCEDVHWRA